ncbi:MAG: GIY-YIG nuclease family protein [bacterium]|nr:GIY-YIG nuclease family protein [bacterium]
MARQTSHIVYIIQSKNNKSYIYKGYTTNLQERLKYHNSGNSKHTSKNRPWLLIFYSSFQSKNKAIDFEKYLKTASGIAFMRKRFIDY